MDKLVMDIETTGLDIYRDDIIEICVLKLDNNYLVDDTFHELLRAKRKLPGRIVKLTGITDEELKDKRYFSEAKNDLRCFIRNHPIYVYGGLEERYFEKKYGFKNKFIDVFGIVKRRYPYFGSYKLLNVAKRFKLHAPESHRAVADTLLLSFLMRELRL